MSAEQTEATVTELPDCDLCVGYDAHTPAVYDAKTRSGPWGYLCERHFQSETTGELGTGHGQRLVVRS